jgi:hypothetical protein
MTDLVNNKIVDCKKLKQMLKEEFANYPCETEEDLNYAVDEYIQDKVENLAYEQIGLDKMSGDIYDALDNVDQFRDTVMDFVRQTWDSILTAKIQKRSQNPEYAKVFRKVGLHDLKSIYNNDTVELLMEPHSGSVDSVQNWREAIEYECDKDKEECERHLESLIEVKWDDVEESWVELTA